jgi:hypothetical protein
VIGLLCLATDGYMVIVQTTKSLSGIGRFPNKEKKKQRSNIFEIYKDEERGDYRFIEASKI